MSATPRTESPLSRLEREAAEALERERRLFNLAYFVANEDAIRASLAERRKV